MPLPEFLYRVVWDSPEKDPVLVHYKVMGESIAEGATVPTLTLRAGNRYLPSLAFRAQRDQYQDTPKDAWQVFVAESKVSLSYSYKQVHDILDHISNVTVAAMYAENALGREVGKLDHNETRSQG